MSQQIAQISLVKNTTNQIIAMSIHSKFTLLYGKREALTSYIKGLQPKTLIICESAIRATLLYTQLISDHKVLSVTDKMDITSGKSYFEMIPTFDVVILTAEMFNIINSYEYFSFLDFKCVIIDDAWYFHTHNIPFDQILTLCTVAIVGFTSVPEKSSVDTLGRYFDSIKKVELEPPQLNCVAVTVNRTFQSRIVQFIKQIQFLCRDFMDGIPFDDYSYGTIEYDLFLRELIDYSMEKNHLCLNYCLLVLHLFHEAYLMSTQDSGATVIEYLDEIAEIQTYYSDAYDAYPREDYLTIYDGIRMEIEGSYSTWKHKLSNVDLQETPKKIVRLFHESIRLFSGPVKSSLLIVTTSGKTVSRLIMTLVDLKPTKITHQALKTIETWKSNISDQKIPAICTRDVFTALCHRHPEFVQSFDSILLVDGMKSYEYWEKCIYFVDGNDEQLSMRVEEKRKYEEMSLREDPVGKKPKYEEEDDRSRRSYPSPPPPRRESDAPNELSREAKPIAPVPPKQPGISPTVLANQACLNIFKQPPKWDPKQLVGGEWQIRMTCGTIENSFVGVGPNQSAAKEKASIMFLEYMDKYY